MRSGKMMEIMKQNLATLLEVIKSPLPTYRYYNSYKVGYWFRNENDADNFRKLLTFNIGFSENRVETLKTYRKPGYIIYITWHESEQEDLIENIEKYLQEDNMGPTNINRENTKFYAIVTDAEGKQTFYEITHPFLETRMECCFGESSVTHTLEFEQGDMTTCDCGFNECVRLRNEINRLKAENENLRIVKNKYIALDASKALEIENLKNALNESVRSAGNKSIEYEKLTERLGKCEDQLRKACEFLNGYHDIHIDIPMELKKLDYFNTAVDYGRTAETRRREFGKKVAESVRKRADERGVWRKSESYRMNEEDNKILDDAVESAINPFYIPNSIYLNLTAGIDLSGTITSIDTDAIYVQQRKSGSSKAMEMIKDMVDKEQLKIRLNSIYGDLYNSRHYSKELMNTITATLNWDVYNAIKDVKFANPATIVFWKDGTKTVVKAQGDEQYIPEVGLAMCICKKVMGNTRDYYRVFKHWMKKVSKEE